MEYLGVAVRSLIVVVYTSFLLLKILPLDVFWLCWVPVSMAYTSHLSLSVFVSKGVDMKPPVIEQFRTGLYFCLSLLLQLVAYRINQGRRGNSLYFPLFTLILFNNRDYHTCIKCKSMTLIYCMGHLYFH